MKDESLERTIRYVAMKNKQFNKDKASHLHKPTSIKKIRRIGKKVLQEMEAKIESK